MGESMDFPKTWEDFLKNYSFNDRKEIYTNGADLIETFRIQQMIEHYFPEKVLKINKKYSADKFIIETFNESDNKQSFMIKERKK